MADTAKLCFPKCHHFRGEFDYHFICVRCRKFECSKKLPCPICLVLSAASGPSRLGFSSMRLGSNVSAVDLVASVALNENKKIRLFLMTRKLMSRKIHLLLKLLSFHTR